MAARRSRNKQGNGDVPEGILCGLGNPLLDMTITADAEFLKKYSLEANDAILAKEEHEEMFKEMIENHNPQYMPGGATMNSIRVAQWLLGKKNATSFFGCVGKDNMADILRKKAEEVGVNVKYMEYDGQPTGVCAAIITGEERSLVSSLGAANYFREEHFDESENWALVEKAKFYYIGGFVFPVCPEAIQKIAHHAAEKKKTLVMNLSASFLCRYFANEEINIMPYVDVLIGNEVEGERFAGQIGCETEDRKVMAEKIAALPKENSDQPRTVIITHGGEPVVVSHKGEVKEFPVEEFDHATIKDTNGCGDAFMGGFLAQLVQGKSLEDCVKCGMYSAKIVAQHWGCNYPEKPDFK